MPVVVADYHVYPRVYFDSDVIPLLTKHGCNGGSCHGKQSGQNGFKLPVFGFDPLQDYLAITTQSKGRRTAHANPHHCLLIRKATGEVPHGGGQRMANDSMGVKLLTEWIFQGSPRANPKASNLSEIRVFPDERVVATSSQQQPIVTAAYSDGTQRDITADAAYTSNSSFIASVEPGGLVRTGNSAGEAGITISYMGQVAVSKFLIPRQPIPRPYPEISTNNEVDSLVWSKLKKMGIVPSDLCDDATFLRRLYIDTIGTLPAPHEVREFISNPDALKRIRAIDDVLAREEYADFWAQRWADILLVDRNKLRERGAQQFHRWLHDNMRRHRPYD